MKRTVSLKLKTSPGQAEQLGLHLPNLRPLRQSRQTHHTSFLLSFLWQAAHADRNAAQNIAILGSVSTGSTGAVNRPNVTSHGL